MTMPRNNLKLLMVQIFKAKNHLNLTFMKSLLREIYFVDVISYIFLYVVITNFKQIIQKIEIILNFRNCCLFDLLAFNGSMINICPPLEFNAVLLYSVVIVFQKSHLVVVPNFVMRGKGEVVLNHSITSSSK